MSSIRKTITASGSTAIQVVRYENRKVVVMKHIGSAKDKNEIEALIESARIWMKENIGQHSLFSKEQRTLPLSTIQYMGVTYTFAYEVLLDVARLCGFSSKSDSLLIDFAIIRLLEPASKLRSIELLSRYFGVQYSERSIYRTLPYLHNRKDNIENIAINCALNLPNSDFSLVLYDVTTLYFETFSSDELRVQGFSKDNKSQQPQIIIGLLVTRQGFPLSYEIFAGNTFEGHTMIPLLESFLKKYKVNTPIVVADAAMLSQANIAELKKRKLSYIVGARLANMSPMLIDKISNTLKQQDGAISRIHTKHGDLVISFSKKRYNKNKIDMEKQIERGKKLIEKNEPGKRAKFVTKDGGDSYVLNKELIEKTKKLLGIRGYYTDISKEDMSDKEIIAHYRDLWHVENTFRMAKSDLSSRPIFHRKKDAICTHMLICFIALAISKYVEIHTQISNRTMRDILWSVTDAKMIDTATKEVFVFRSPINNITEKFLRDIGLSY